VDAPAVSLDFETRARVDLRKSGVYPYARDEDTDIWCFGVLFPDEEEVRLWYPWHVDSGQSAADREYIREKLDAHVLQGGIIRAWNAQFERIIWREILGPRYGFAVPALEQYHCTMAEAAAMGLPKSLDRAAEVVGLKEGKDVQGYQLMMRMTKPRSEKGGDVVWWNLRDRVTRLGAYCTQDVKVEVQMAAKTRRLNAVERQVWLEDQRVNDRGVLIDVDLVRAAKVITEESIERASAALSELTDGAVTKPSQVAKIKQYLSDTGLQVESLNKPAIAELLSSDLSEQHRAIIETRRDSAKSSVKKLDAMLACVGDDNRARGLLQYHSAGPGRWGGRLIQPQNFVRSFIKNVERYIPDVLAERYDYLDMFESPLDIVACLMRGMLIPTPGHRFVVADYGQVEARLVNWFADQQDVLDNFRAKDAGDKSRDPYKMMAVSMGRGATVADIDDAGRQAGKAAELGCGFQMGWRKFVSAAWDVYQVRVNDEQAKVAVAAYRATHPKVKAFWYEMNRKALAAVRKPGEVQYVEPYGRVRFVKAGGYLWMVLPSGRTVAYARPRIVPVEKEWEDAETGKKTRSVRATIEAEGEDSQTRQWTSYYLYGGIFTNHAVQGSARDLLAAAMLRAPAKGYTTVLTVHDELVAEVPLGVGSVQEYEHIVATLPAWAEGCPIIAEGWEGARYRK
jgi:DNA polymerase